ncbi:TonB-dependent receptor plug domain-containing protein [Acanthopleuribacter pedis]|uniref:TonB-dependent receptor n=1 Tax=Acanthopleuribacter pedis TaxID=442870 RepID=A0A8J7U6N8_9BACT|nr:TonB-dependent receptor [Acanthopleuribacter pedis]MBO1322124.1 TonB-dependent receptor [Acanthopleuribacter pedis]
MKAVLGKLFRYLWPVLFCVLLTAADDADDLDLGNLSLEELLDIEVVSATRSSSKLSESPIPISVITAKDIAASGADSIPAVLARLAEIDVLPVGASQTEVSIRGKNINFNRRLLVLIDGRTEYNDLFGVTLWHAFPIGLEDIERIEVVRGPASALFGANAFSGVINIITKAVDGEQPSVLHVAAGSQGRQDGRFFYRRHKDRFGFKLSANQHKVESHETDVTFPGFNRFPTTYNFNPDDDSLEMTRATLSLSWQPNDKLDLKLSGGFSDGEMELFPQPGLPREDWDVNGENIHLTVNYQVGETGALQFNAYINSFDYETPLLPLTEDVLAAPDGQAFYPSFNEARLFAGTTETTNISLQYVGSAVEERVNYVLGVESREIENEGGLVADSDKDINSVFANFTYRLSGDKFMIGMGVRLDDDSITDQDSGYTASLMYFPNDTTTLRLSARRAFRAPSLFELFSQVEFNVPNQNNRVRFRGNSGLAVETIDTVDLTVTTQIGETIQFTGELFFEEYADLIGNPDSGLLSEIEFDPETNVFTTTTSFQNLSDADNVGVQLGLVWVPNERVSVYGNAMWLDPKDLNDLSGETFFSPETKLNLGLTWNLPSGFSTHLSAHHVGETSEDEFKVGDLSPDGPNFARDNQEAYTLVNVKLGYRFKKQEGLELFVASRNLLDDDFVAYYEFDTVLNATGERMGREVEGGLSWRF